MSSRPRLSSAPCATWSRPRRAWVAKPNATLLELAAVPRRLGRRRHLGRRRREVATPRGPPTPTTPAARSTRRESLTALPAGDCPRMDFRQLRTRPAATRPGPAGGSATSTGAGRRGVDRRPAALNDRGSRRPARRPRTRQPASTPARRRPGPTRRRSTLGSGRPRRQPRWQSTGRSSAEYCSGHRPGTVDASPSRNRRQCALRAVTETHRRHHRTIRDELPTAPPHHHERPGHHASPPGSRLPSPTTSRPSPDAPTGRSTGYARLPR